MYTCVKKYDDGAGLVKGFDLKNEYGTVTYMPRDTLLAFMDAGAIEVDNIKLCSDGIIKILKPKKDKVSLIIEKATSMGMIAQKLDCGDNKYCILLSKDSNTHAFIIPDNIVEVIDNTEACDKLKELKGDIEVRGGKGLTTTRKLFWHIDKANSIDISALDTSNVTNMDEMFRQTKSKIIGIENLVTNNVITANQMFYGYANRESIIDLSNCDFGKLENITKMFNTCIAEEIILPEAGMPKALDFSFLFAQSEITNLDLSKTYLGNLDKVNSIFDHFKCENLNMSNNTTFNLTEIYRMFYRSNISNLNIDNLNLSNIKSISQMFYDATIRTLNVKCYTTYGMYLDRAEFIELTEFSL